MTAAPTITRQYIPDLMARVIEEMNETMEFEVFYDFGRVSDIVQNLTEKDGSVSLKGRKYPLIWLVMDFEERYMTSVCELNLKMFIVDITEATYNMEKRRDEVFLPILYPIYTGLLTALSQSTTFGRPSFDRIEHTKIDRPYWSGQDNVFNDHIDAIEINNLKLFVKRKLC
jgi:hypothetical protein